MNQNVSFTHLGKPLNLFVKTAASQAPVSTGLEIKSLHLSAGSIMADQVLTLSVQLEGEQIAHIYAVAYLLKEGFAYGPIYQQYCIAPQSKTVGGVTYPKWDGEINLSHNFSLGLPVLVNAEQESLGFGIPQSYGIQDEEQKYQVIGWYTRTGKPEQKKARLRFDAQGKLLSVMSAGKKESGIAREITPQTGDVFIPLARRFQMADGVRSADQDDLMHADEIALSWNTKRTNLPAIPGEYAIGIIIEDMDGHRYRQCRHVTVESSGTSM